MRPLRAARHEDGFNVVLPNRSPHSRGDWQPACSYSRSPRPSWSRQQGSRFEAHDRRRCFVSTDSSAAPRGIELQLGTLASHLASALPAGKSIDVGGVSYDPASLEKKLVAYHELFKSPRETRN